MIRFSVTPDPGVLEVNVQPTRSGRECAEQIDQVFDAALHVGLHSEKYMLDGRQEGSGGGNHITLGGPRALESPFVIRPDLLASLVTFVQHHPAISYLFTGLFVGPTSQAPRVDEARHDSLYELEIALARLADRSQPAPPWLGDWLLRNLLVDVAGNGHRAEISIDKLFDWRSPHGRQGLVELRAFEMPPHPRMAAAQAILARALVAAFAKEPYAHGLVRWGTELHDRFLLPFWLWRDMEDVLAFLDGRGIGLPRDAYRPFVEFRCPVVGRLQVGGVAVEVRNALEPWPVLGEEPGGGGTSRYVDSSMERIEVRAEGLETERLDVLVNGIAVPLRPTGTAGEHVGGVRFRAWAPESSLQPHLGIHHPLRFDLWDRWARRSVGACPYHVWHPEGRGYEAAPLTRFEATARRAPRFTVEGPLPGPPAPAWPVRIPSTPTPSTCAGTAATVPCPSRRRRLMEELLAECRAQDEVLRGAGLEIWVGAEPTFTDRSSQDPWLWLGGGRRQAGPGRAAAPRAGGAPGRLLPARPPRGRHFEGEQTPRFCLGAAYLPPRRRGRALAHRDARPRRGRGEHRAGARPGHLLPSRGLVRRSRGRRALAGPLPLQRPGR